MKVKEYGYNVTEVKRSHCFAKNYTEKLKLDIFFTSGWKIKTCEQIFV